ncbi:hypothetical protein T07_4013 [Trichinella nelsoni]|uniref:Uncharacterized protein n=1 Tax=Trichinella nelsoni TaxID=6336 RepID=A0A0V0SCI4_9BILA|nr:hypothetical protein T07_4013 [Trichinella nelsoni]
MNQLKIYQTTNTMINQLKCKSMNMMIVVGVDDVQSLSLKDVRTSVWERKKKREEARKRKQERKKEPIRICSLNLNQILRQVTDNI